MSICIYVYIYRCIYVCVHVYTYNIYTHIYAQIFQYIYIHIYIHTFICIFTHAHILYIDVYTCIHNCKLSSSFRKKIPADYTPHSRPIYLPPLRITLALCMPHLLFPPPPAPPTHGRGSTKELR